MKLSIVVLGLALACASPSLAGTTGGGGAPDDGVQRPMVSKKASGRDGLDAARTRPRAPHDQVKLMRRAKVKV